jgi:hypothetical protein
MSRFEIQDATGYLDGCCFGTWSMSDAGCSKCGVAKDCEQISKKGVSAQDEEATQEIILTEEEKKLPDIPPLQYMLALLESKYDSHTKENDKATGHYYTKDGKDVLTVIVAKTTGKVKLFAGEKSRLVDGINSIEDAEELVKELVG